MSIYNHICREFCFLTESGFVMTDYLGDGMEIVYDNGKSKIIVMYCVGIDDCLNKKESVDIIIDINNNRQNLLSCNLFDIDELNLLKQALNVNKPKKQIEILAQFLKRNIGVIK